MTGRAEPRNFFGGLLEFCEQSDSPCKRPWPLTGGSEQGKDRARLHWQGPQFPIPPAHGQSAQVFLVMSCGSWGQKQSVWSYQKTQPQGLLKGVAGLQHSQKLWRKNEWRAHVMESAVECFQRGSPKNYKRGSFDHLQNTKRRRLKLLPNSQKEPPLYYASSGACSSPSTCSSPTMARSWIS